MSTVPVMRSKPDVASYWGKEDVLRLQILELDGYE
jgi:hypothetical protein